MVLEFSWPDCCVPCKDLWHAVARILEGNVRHRSTLRGLCQGPRGSRRYRHVKVWRPQNKMLKGKNAVGEREGAKW